MENKPSKSPRGIPSWEQEIWQNQYKATTAQLDALDNRRGAMGSTATASKISAKKMAPQWVQPTLPTFEACDHQEARIVQEPSGYWRTSFENNKTVICTVEALSALVELYNSLIDRVRAVHIPDTLDPSVCLGCYESYPCQTIEALEVQ